MSEKDIFRYKIFLFCNKGRKIEGNTRQKRLIKTYFMSLLFKKNTDFVALLHWNALRFVKIGIIILFNF